MDGPGGRAVGWLLAVLVLAGLLSAVPAQAAGTPTTDRTADGPSAFATPELRARHLRRPLFKKAGFADPSVVRYRQGYVGVATGPLAPRTRAGRAEGPWRRAGTALVRRPRWASSRSVWAGDVVRVGPRWLLYFAAPVRGLGEEGRCIGVAAAGRPTGRFRVVGRSPLVCPREARVPQARDTLTDRARSLPRRGVIDAEVFTKGRHRYLVYRTQGTPSSIRLVRLRGDGQAVAGGARSRELVRADGIVENPSLVRRGRAFYLLTSEGYYGDCGYRTTWRRTTRLWDWSRSWPRVLVDTASSGLCGPGGADVVSSAALRDGRARRALVVLHGWSCPHRGGPCPDTGVDYQRSGRWAARRSLYAAWLWWRHGRPRVTSFVLPSRRTPEPPAPLVPPAPAPPIPVPEPREVVIGPVLRPLLGPGL